MRLQVEDFLHLNIVLLSNLNKIDFKLETNKKKSFQCNFLNFLRHFSYFLVVLLSVVTRLSCNAYLSNLWDVSVTRNAVERKLNQGTLWSDKKESDDYVRVCNQNSFKIAQLKFKISCNLLSVWSFQFEQKSLKKNILMSCIWASIEVNEMNRGALWDQFWWFHIKKALQRKFFFSIRKCFKSHKVLWHRKIIWKYPTKISMQSREKPKISVSSFLLWKKLRYLKLVESQSFQETGIWRWDLILI